MLDPKTLGENIKRLRRQRALTQAAFAEAIHVSFQAVSNWERGIAPPDLNNLISIAAYFGVLVDDLIRAKSEDLYLGIDGGGTKTELAVISKEGYVLKRLVKSGCNPNDIGYSKTAALIFEGIDEMLMEFPSVKAVFCGIAGIASGDYAARLESDLKKRYPQMDREVKNDAQNLFAFDDGADMAVISGTGSVVFVKSGDSYKRIGGWGHLLDSAGSAYDIGREALRVSLYEEDMKLSPSILYRSICKRLNTHTVWEHISTVYKEGKPYIAGLASTVFEAYKMGDEKAISIIDSTAKALAERLDAGVSLYGASPVAIASGGLFEHYGDIMIEHIKKYSRVRLIAVDLPPIFGACKKALATAGVELHDEFYQNFKRTYGGTKQ